MDHPRRRLKLVMPNLRSTHQKDVECWTNFGCKGCDGCTTVDRVGWINGKERPNFSYH